MDLHPTETNKQKSVFSSSESRIDFSKKTMPVMIQNHYIQENLGEDENSDLSVSSSMSRQIGAEAQDCKKSKTHFKLKWLIELLSLKLYPS